MSWDSLNGDSDSALGTGGVEVRQKADPAGDLDEITAIKKIDQMEIEIVDSLLRQIDKSAEAVIDRQNLLELRNLCQLRSKILKNLNSEYLATHGAA